MTTLTCVRPTQTGGAQFRWGKALAKAATALLGIIAVHALAANSISDIQVTKVTAGRTLVRVTTKDPLTSPPAAFMVNNPPRIALDFADTENGLGKTVQEANEQSVRSLSIVQAGNRTRLVINLNKPQNFDTQVEGNSLLITLNDQAAASPAVTSTVSHFAESKATAATHGVRDVDFRRGRNGEGRIVVDLSDNSTGIDIRQQGKTIVVDFLKTSLPQNLERRLDVGDFATPVRTVDTFAQGENTRMVIEPTGLWEHSAYQAENRFVIEIKPIAEDPNKLTQGTRPGYNGEKLSLNFQNIEVRSVLQVIADFTGFNIVTSDTVGGNLTLRLKDVPWDQALDIILQTKGLDLRKNGNVILIAPREELAVKEQAALKAREEISNVEPLQTEAFQLNYQRAREVASLLRGQSQGQTVGAALSILSKRGTASFDVRTNTLFVQDTASRLEEVRRIIARIDVPVRQVQIEARVVIADDKFSRQLGARFGSQAGWRLTNNYNVGTSGSLSSSDQFANGVTPGSIIPPGSGPLNVNLPVQGAAGTLALTFLNLGSGNLINLELSALEANNRGKVLSNPRVVTSDNEKAQIVQGTQIPYITPGSSQANIPAVAFKDAVLSLDVTPRITPDGKVVMQIEVKKDSVGAIFSGIPSIDTKRVTTQIAVNNGETAVLGGIFEEVQRDDVTKVPLLGDIPVIGNVFKTTTRTNDKTELLIFITPRIISENVTAVR